MNNLKLDDYEPIVRFNEYRKLLLSSFEGIGDQEAEMASGALWEVGRALGRWDGRVWEMATLKKGEEDATNSESK